MAIRGLGRSWLGALTVAGALVLAAGCGDDDEPADERTTAAEETEATETESGTDTTAVFDTDPCSLLTEADVKALLGKAVDGKLEVEGDAEAQQPGQCLWESGEPVDLAAPNTTPSTIIVSAGDQLWYDNNVSLVEADESFEEIDGLADAAFAGNTRGGFLAGGAGITAELGISSDPASHEVVLDALERVEANYENEG
jgi:hypothetical protein